MSSGGSTTTVQKSDPWKPAQPALQGAIGQAQGLYSSGAGQNYYPFRTNVTPSNQTQQAWSMAENLANTVPGYMSGAGGLLGDTISGQYLADSNPYLETIYNRGADSITDRVNSVFGASGRTGSGYHQKLLQEGLGDYRAQLFGGQYAQERDNQMRAMAMAPMMDQARYTPVNIMQNVGQGREAYAQAELQDLMNRHDFMNAAPDEAFNRYLGRIGMIGGQGNYGTMTSPRQGGGAIGALGGAAAGAGLGTLLGAGAGGAGAGLMAGGVGAAGTAAAAAAAPPLWPFIVGGGLLGAFG